MVFSLSSPSSWEVRLAQLGHSWTGPVHALAMVAAVLVGKALGESSRPIQPGEGKHVPCFNFGKGRERRELLVLGGPMAGWPFHSVFGAFNRQVGKASNSEDPNSCTGPDE